MATAADIMTQGPVTIRPTRTVAEASRILDQLAIRHLPVVDAGGELVGMLSDRDLRGALTAAEEDLAPSVPPPGARVSDVMSTDVVVADAEDEIAMLAQLMIDAHIGAVPIVDRDGVLIGIVSYVDLLRVLSGPLDVPRAPAIARRRR